MAGVNYEGFEQKRLQQVIADMETEARSNFGSSISTDVNSVLGRSLRIVAQPVSDLWEGNEQVYNSFFPDRATGVSLDALAALAGITRFKAKPTICPVHLTAMKDSIVPAGSTVSSSFTGELFDTTTIRFFDLSQTIALQIEPVNAIAGNTYSVEYDGSTVTYVAQVGDTVESIAAEFVDKFNEILIFDAEVVEDNEKLCYITSKDPFKTYSFVLSSNIVAREVTEVASVRAYEAGPLEQPVGTVDTVASPVSGWVSVNNPVDAIPGRNRETDIQLRIRFANSKETRASNTLEAIYSDLQGVQGLNRGVVYENVLDEIDYRGLPPHSVAIVADGGSSLEIADLLWRNKPTGIQTYGNTTVTIIDSMGFPRDMNFIRPDEIPLYITINIAAKQGFPADGSEQIKQYIIDYINENYSIGDDIVYSRLYTPINKVANHEVNSLFIGTSPNPTGTSNVEVSFDRVARTQTSYINIIV